MKVKIKVNEYVSLESFSDDEIEITIRDNEEQRKSALVIIDDLRLAIRKLTAK